MAINTLVSDKIIARVESHAHDFLAARPFRHVVIDDFFAEAVAADLLRQFPPFEHGNARTENGDVGNKSTVERIRGLGPAYATLDNVIQSRAFLDFIGRITGIDKLLYDPWYFGGGTHCNRAGQELDVHVDFNRHPVRRWHRRLNLIVYLNPDWQEHWGGQLELHSDPRSDNDEVIRINPLFNRCVIFETTEHSWHGFDAVCPPPDQPDLMRRSVALYFYTTNRPAAELADTHSTIYVDRPLPEHIKAGHTLSEADVADIRALLTRRDQHNQRLYRDLGRLQGRLDRTLKLVTLGAWGPIRQLLALLRNRPQP